MKKIIAFLMMFTIAFVLIGCQKDPVLSFASTEIVVAIDGTHELVPVVENAKDWTTITFSVADPTILKVESSKIIPLKIGTTKVTATLDGFENANSVVLNVTVESSIQSVSISGQSTVKIGEQIKLTATVTPAGKSQEVIWVSDDTSIATVDSSGNVSGIKEGKVKIYATSAVDNVTKGDFEVTVILPSAERVEVTGNAQMKTNEEQTLVANVIPGVALQSVEWSSENPEIATVDANGKVKAIAVGTVKIIATAKDGSNAKGDITIVISSRLATKIEITGKVDMYVNEEQMLTVTLTPDDASDEIEWSSSSIAIASVDANGKVIANAAGTVIITAKTLDGSELTDSITIEIISDVKLVNPALDGTTVGTTITYNGTQYVFGTTAFSKLSDAIAVGGNILLAPGTYSEDVTITKPTTITGPNAGINPNLRLRAEEAIITGKIEVSGNVDGVTIDGLAFTKDGCFDVMITNTNPVRNVKFINNYAYECNDDSNAWGTSQIKYNSVVRVWSDGGVGIYNITIDNNKFAGVQKTNILLARVSDVSIQNNSFRNFGRDAIRTDGGYNEGIWNINNNTFENDVLSAYNGIFLRTYSGSATASQTININYNTFKNIGVTATQYSGAISSNVFNEENTYINVLYNIFENCTNYVHLRNNGIGSKIWDVKVNYNIFIGIPEDYYSRNFNYTTDTAATNPETMDFQYNCFVDNSGNVITNISTISSKIKNTKTYANHFTSDTEYYTQVGKTKLVSDLYVDNAWAGKANGETVIFDGISLKIGDTAFATILSALEKAIAGTRIYVASGEYAEEINIDKNNISLIGANYEIDPNNNLRNPEAKITNIVTITASANVEINGFLFTGSGRIEGPSGGIKNLKVAYCTFDSDIMLSSSTVGLITLNCTNTDKVNENVSLLHNRFENTGKRTMAILATQLHNFQFNYNYYQTTKSTALYTDALKLEPLTGGTGVSGVTEFIGNTFVDVAQYTIWIRQYSAGTIHVLGNTFTNCGIPADGYFRAPVTLGTYVTTEDGKFVINIKYNTFTAVDTAARLECAAATATNWEANVNYNIFESIAKTVILGNNGTNTLKLINADFNYFDKAVTDANFSAGVISYANNYANKADVPKYVGENVAVLPTSVTIKNKTTDLVQEEKLQLDVEVGPGNATQKRVTYTSSDPTVASISSSGEIRAIKAGTTKITVKCATDDSIFDEFTITIKEYERIEVTYENNAMLKVGDQLDIDATLMGAPNVSDFVWSSSNTSIADVSLNKIIAVGKGNATITVKTSDGKYELKFGVTIYDPSEYSELMNLLIDGNKGSVLNQNILYIGSDDGSADYLHNIYGSVNSYYATQLPEIEKNMLDKSAANHPNRKLDSLEFITIHDTAGSPASSTARNNSLWCTNPGNTGTSWHYTIGNEGIFQQLEDDDVGWHAGDGTGIAFAWLDSGINANGNSNPEFDIDAQGYIVINGTKSSVITPTGSNGAILTKNNFPETGITWKIGTDGKYYIGKMHYNYVTTNNINKDFLTSYGGNLNSIGIETAVNAGSDVYLTWQITAKFTAQLLVKHNLGTERVRFHNNFSGKICPRTMMTAGLSGEFLKMIEIEYLIAKNYSDCTIEFISHDPTILDNTGRIIKSPVLTTNVSYTIKVTNGTTVEEITLNALVPGMYNKNM